jgi:glycosidase
MPKLRVEHSAGARVPVRRGRSTGSGFGIDGWRLDVRPTSMTRPFWPEFRRRVRAVRPDAYLVGELWGESPEWLTGDRFDALMNYPLGMAILGFASGGRLDQAAIDGQSDYRAFLRALDGPGFGERVHSASRAP